MQEKRHNSGSTNYVQNELAAIKTNIIAGSKLAFFQKSSFPKFCIGLDQAVYLSIINFLLDLFIGYVQHYPDPEFNVFGISGYGLEIVGLIISAFIVAKLAKDDNVFVRFLVVTSSLGPFFYFVTIILTQYAQNIYFYAFVIIWVFAVVMFIAAHYLERKIGKTLIAISTYGTFTIFPVFMVNSGDLWYQKTLDDPYYEKTENINQENLFYGQFQHLEAIKRELLPSRSSVTDLYFLGFGSYSKENVFKTEIEYIQGLMDKKYDTKGRSVGLINHPDTMETTPLATRSNLERTIASIGQVMDKEEDIFFLYLTSHGSRKPELSVSFWPLKLNQVSPNHIKDALDKAGIKWRIILVSACYSGGFVDILENEHTIIMTASAKDRTSFGCGKDSDFTYFGRAVFIDQLSKYFSFIPAFEEAKVLISKREKEEKLTPSLPQLSIGVKIRTKLDQLEKELDAHYRLSNDAS